MTRFYFLITTFFPSLGIFLLFVYLCLFVLTLPSFAQSAVPMPSATCSFTKGDQNPKALPYSSPKLVSYFKEVSEKTGVPATLLAGVARVESTTGKYTISNYTDADLQLMEDTSKILQNIDAVIPGTQKALCPRSPTGALGVMQIQPSKKVLDSLKLSNENIRNGFNPNAHSVDSVNNGARFIGKNDNTLTAEDYCNPKTSIYIAAGFILKKMQGKGYGDGTKWDPAWNTNEKAFDAAAESYYGCLKYPSCQNGPNSYGNDLWQSFNSCKEDTFTASAGTASTSTTSSSGGGSMESNEVITRVGNPPVEGGSCQLVKTFYCQGDQRWANQCNMAGSGCGPTTMAMILTSFGDKITPNEVDLEFRNRKWRGCGEGSRMETAIGIFLPEKGYTYKALDLKGGQLDLEKTKEYLDNGYLVIGSTLNHIFALHDVDIAGNQVMLMDPGLCTNNPSVTRSNRAPWNGEGWYYAYAVKKNETACLAPTGQPGKVTADGKHACPIQLEYTPYTSPNNVGQNQFSYVCAHSRPIYNANDVFTSPSGGTPVVAVVDGKAENITNPVGGPAIWLVGNDGRNYYYAHLREESLVTGQVKAGQVIGKIAAANENAIAKNNSVAHVHISAGTPGNQHTFSDPANIPMGPLLDEWCGVNVCKGNVNVPF